MGPGPGRQDTVVVQEMKQVLVLFLTMAYDTALTTYFATTVGNRD